MDELLKKLFEEVLGGSFTPPPTTKKDEPKQESSKRNETPKQCRSLKSKEEVEALNKVKEAIDSLVDAHKKNTFETLAKADFNQLALRNCTYT